MFNKKLLSSIDLGKYAKKNPYKKDMILDPMGQWKHPGKNTRIPSSSITMKGVNYPVLGVSNTGQKQMMQPGQEYNFPGADYVDEYPQMKRGGLTKAQTGIATYQDSLDVYNNALQQQAYYDKLKPYYNKVTTQTNYLDFAQVKKAEKELLASDVQPYWTPQDKANFQKTKNIIKANKDKNIAYLTDIITGALDPNAPGLRYDARIKPQGVKNYDPYTSKYTSKEQQIIDKIRKKYGDELQLYDGKQTWLTKKDALAKGKKLGYTEKEITNILYKAKKDSAVRENLKGFYTTIPYYDPLAVKPGRLLTDDEIKKRVEKYGTDGIPEDKLEKLGLKDSRPPKKDTSKVVKSPCSNPITTVVNNVPEKAPFGKKLVGTNSETLPVTGKKCEYVKTINPIYEDLIIEPIKLGRFPERIDNGPLPPLQVHDYTLPDSIEAPQYALDPYTDDRLRLSVTPGKSRKVTKRGRLSGGQRYKHTEYKPTKDLEFGKKEVTKPIAALVQKLTGYDPKYFEGYEDEEGNFVPGELDYGNATGSEMEFRGAASLRDYMNQQKYKKEYAEYDKKLDTWLEQYEQSKKKQAEGQAFKKGGAKKKYTSDIINSTNYLFAEHPLFKKKKQSKKRIYDPKAKYYADGGELLEAKYGHSIGNLIRKQKGGQLPRAQFGLAGTGEDRSLSFTPFDFRSSYGQTSDFNRNPNYSLTYNTPKLFKKADLAGNPLSITLGRPYNTDAESLTNRTLNFMPQEGLFSSYYDPATQGGSNPQYQQYLQNVSGTTGTPVSELNQTVLNQYNAAKNLAGAKPLYKKGIPLTANVGWDFIGNAFGDASSGPFTGYGSFNAGYAPEPGLYGTADLGMMGVFGRRKNNASIKPQRYFDKGLTRQGDMAFIPKLNILNVALRQRPEYNESQTQQILDAYAKDIEQGTTTAKDFITNKTDESKFDLSFLSPELTYQVKPFKDIPGILSATAGARLDYGGKDSSGNRIPIKPLPYGNVRYTVPIEGAIDKLKDLNLPAVKRKKTYNDYANDQEYDEEYTGDTPQEDTPTENNIEVNPPELQVNPNGTVLDRGDCPEGYERPCPKCRCEKIKMPQMYTDKRGTHLFGNEPIRFKDGGEKEAMNAMMKARLAYANMFGNPSAQRMINIPDQPYEFDNGDMGTHYMASMDNYAVPQIQDENGQLMLGNYGPESREAIRFDSDEDANYFAENYKDVSPGFIDLELTEDQIEEYRKGGYVVEDISVPSLTRMQPGGLIKSLKPVIKGVTESVKNIDKVKQASKIGKDISAIGKEILGEVLQGSSNRKAIASGNSWLNNWISNPITQAKIQEDILGAPLNSDVSPNYFSAYSTPVYGDRAITDYDKYIYALDLAKDFKPGVTEYPISTQITDFIEGLSTGDAHSHLNNKGFSTMHTEDPFQRELYKSGYYKPNSTVIDRDYSPYRNYGSFVSRDRSISPYDRESISIHEGTHDWITDWLLRKTGQSNLIQSQLDPDYLDLYNKWKNKDKTLTKLEKNKGYYADPTEVHARIMQLRRHNDLTPFDMITDENSGYFMDQLLKNNVPFNGPLFAEMLGNDRNKLAKLMNDLYGIALPVGVATGAGALLANPYQDQSPIGEYKNGGQYGLGDEVDEATMKQLKKLGFTFEKI